MGIAPTSVVTDPVFGTDAASLYLPAFHKMAARVGLAPTPNGLTGRRATFTLPGKGLFIVRGMCTINSNDVALPAGVAPASVRLEDECLISFGHGSNENGRNGRILTRGLPVPGRALSRLSYIPMKMADPKGVAPSTLPQTTGRSAD